MGKKRERGRFNPKKGVAHWVVVLFFGLIRAFGALQRGDCVVLLVCCFALRGDVPTSRHPESEKIRKKKREKEKEGKREREKEIQRDRGKERKRVREK